MCCLPMLFGRTTACATWALISNATPVNSGSVTGQNDTSFGVSNANPQFSGSYGIGAYDWGMNSQWSPNQYFEFKVSPAALNTFNISNVSFDVFYDGSQPMNLETSYSLDNFNSTSIPLVNSLYGTSVSVNNTTISIFYKRLILIK